MQERKDLINFFIEKFNYKTYLEIGVKSETKTFVHVRCTEKEGVDPNGCTTHTMQSDQFFSSISTDKKWDIIFIDGDHERSQVKRDIENALAHLTPGGTIVCHDVNPKEEYLLAARYCDNAWQAFAELRSTRSDIAMYTLPFDHIGFIQVGQQNTYNKPIEYTWNFLDKNRKELMNELSMHEFYALFS
jgi:hypothetical protein